MLLVDNVLFSPFKGLLWIFREINEVVQRERDGEAADVTRALSDLYLRLEGGSITEDEFAAEETRMLDRLDAIQARDSDDEEAEDEEAEDEEQDALEGAPDTASEADTGLADDRERRNA